MYTLSHYPFINGGGLIHCAMSFRVSILSQHDALKHALAQVKRFSMLPIDRKDSYTLHAWKHIANEHKQALRSLWFVAKYCWRTLSDEAKAEIRNSFKAIHDYDLRRKAG